MEQFDVMRHVLDVLQRLDLTYAIVGSMASMAYGEPRMTRDIDIVIDLSVDQVGLLCREFPPPDWYVSETAALDAVRRGGQFNAIHTTSGNKIDFIMSRRDDWGRLQLKRRQIVGIAEDCQGFAAHPEDVILGKLIYFKEGGSEKHLRDIAGILQVSGELIDLNSVAVWAERLQVADEWRALISQIKSK
jgi:hypothetical protein